MKPGTGADPMVHVNFAGDGSMLPVMSIARTSNVRIPVGMFSYVRGEVHGSQPSFGAGRSSLHSNTAIGSSLENAKVALVRTVIGSGREVISVSGGVTSTGGTSIVHVRTAGVGSTLPLRSTAATSNVCVPGRRSEYTSGVVQGANAPAAAPSSRHWNVR